eukprot:gnl/MRDRNA2_/MRDRNA2_84327_c0_seq2.p2 gnl/MRDRNA2_/MRDRNA2_84327_c0~~gnl/MRDRNA2_/MRDRNA2_84327_c0_seq2.p2  ORF type:complete len:109 (+),score=3.82 gnl/MRDRNA2_/MRDRNA2_84327_c0_seq2:595-921(+)
MIARVGVTWVWHSIGGHRRANWSCAGHRRGHHDRPWMTHLKVVADHFWYIGLGEQFLKAGIQVHLRFDPSSYYMIMLDLICLRLSAPRPFKYIVGFFCAGVWCRAYAA